LNQLLIRAGLALNFEPYARGRFKVDESSAKERRIGLWKGCFVAPQDFRHWDKKSPLLGAACANDKDRGIREVLFPDDPAMPPGCEIKAKFSTHARLANDVGIYHLQGCRSYGRLKKPDRWFCTEEDALAARFRKAHNCRTNARRN
jgi:hypothetical protein